MENLLGFLFFIAISIIGLIAKAREERKAKERREAPPKSAPEDLPEQTRRMLYGDPEGGPRTAAPRGAAPEGPRAPMPPMMAPTAGMPRREMQPRPSMRETMRPEEPERQAPRPQPARQPVPQPHRPTTLMGELERKRQELKQALDQTTRQARETLEEASRQRRPRRKKQAAEAVPVESASEMTVARTVATPTPQREKRSQVLESMLRSMFSDGDAVRRGIIVHEILGTPKGLDSEFLAR